MNYESVCVFVSHCVYPSCVLRTYQLFPNSTLQKRPPVNSHRRYTVDAHELTIFFSTRLTKTPLTHSCLRLNMRTPLPTTFNLFLTTPWKPTKRAQRTTCFSIPSRLSSRPADLRAPFSPSQQQVQELDQSRMSDESLTKWLEPTVTGLYAFSETIGEGVSPVSHEMNTSYIRTLILIWQASHKSDIFRSWCSPFSAFPISSHCLSYL